jgi:hypothetical protein
MVKHTRTFQTSLRKSSQMCCPNWMGKLALWLPSRIMLKTVHRYRGILLLHFGITIHCSISKIYMGQILDILLFLASIFCIIKCRNLGKKVLACNWSNLKFVQNTGGATIKSLRKCIIETELKKNYFLLGVVVILFSYIFLT